ncbi:HAD hydrolase-like protein [Candidatus Gracilibacteria bacterium]|nr:HAD hydrolase-like protein [Candidatus Gracilibacteria bacterium]
MLADISFYNICQRNRKDIPREFVLLVVDHIKSVALKVMHGYVVKSLVDNDYFDEENWNYLDSLIKSLWEGYAGLIFDENGKITGTLSFNYLLTLLDEVEYPLKIKELDSAKNLLRFAVSVQNSGCVFDTCMSLLFGGVEIPYALHGFMSVFPSQSIVNIVPAIFSLNRMVKGEIPRSILDGNGLVEVKDLKKIIPRFFLKKLNLENNLLVVDNNITTGYSLKIIVESMKKVCSNVYCGIPEVYLEEILNIAKQIKGFEYKEVMILGSDLTIQPIDKYVTCFGKQDDSRVVNGVRFLLGKADYTQVTGYDFDDTIAETGKLHGIGWNKALEQMGYPDLNVWDLPSNSGMTNFNAGLNIYHWIVGQNHSVNLEPNQFAKRLVELKVKAMMEYPLFEIPLIASTINEIRRNNLVDTQIIVTNNLLEFVKHFLEMRNLLRYFTFIICEDYALSVHSGEKVRLKGCAKPSIDAYKEASEFFSIPSLETFYGDKQETDGEFARKLGCKFIYLP